MVSYSLQTIPIADVDEYPDRYNTADHRISEHRALKNELKVKSKYDSNATRFDHWLPLILRSRAVATQDVITFSLPRRTVDILIQCTTLFLVVGKINKEIQHDLEQEPAFQDLVRKNILSNGWFCRADDVSPKDAIDAGKPIKTISDLIIRLMSSGRLHNAYVRAQSMCRFRFQLHLLPWDESITTLHEFRVFVPATQRITAISQYSWHRPFPESLVPYIQDIVEQADGILKDILEFSQTMKNKSIAQGQPFTFDVHWRAKEKKCELIELNGFGALELTGSCLFNWVQDRHIIYDEDDGHGPVKAPIVFRITK